MRDRLQRRFLVRKEVARRGSYEGDIALSELPRLTEMTGPANSGTQTVDVRFEFSLNEFECQQVIGSLSTRLRLQCQRCLETMELPVAVDFHLLVDADEQMAQASGLDCVNSVEGYLDLFDLVEDEIILAIPLITVHEDEDCNEYWPDATEEPVERENPFAVLKGLKT